MAIALGVLDYVTGREWTISAFHLLPTCLAAWVAGRPAGFAVGALRTVAWFVSDMLSGAAYTRPVIPVWNALMLFAFFFVVVWLQLWEAVQNVVRNAVDAMPQGWNLSVSATRSDSKARISDTGLGIPRRKRASLYRFSPQSATAPV